jgi:hypothetical protein
LLVQQLEPLQQERQRVQKRRQERMLLLLLELGLERLLERVLEQEQAFHRKRLGRVLTGRQRGRSVSFCFP